MLLCLDIGNSHIFGGVFSSDKLLLRFRHPTYSNVTSDQLGTFLKNVLRENDFDYQEVTAIALCSVVPAVDYSLRAACKKYFQVEPFVLTPLTEVNVKIETTKPEENGSDIIAEVVGALAYYPKQDLIVVDFGTVTTMAAVTMDREYLGVTFIPGVCTAMNSLQASAANLFPVEIIRSSNVLGKTTIESMQAGIFFGHLGAIKEITTRIAKEVFQERPVLLATGGFAHLFKEAKLFDYLEPDLVLHGIRIAYELNNK